MGTQIIRSQFSRLYETAPNQFSEIFTVIKRLGLKYRVKRDRDARRCPYKPAKPTMNIMAGATQCAMLQLEIDGVKFPDLAAYFLNMAVTEFADPTVAA